MQALASSEIHLLLQLKPGVPSQVLAGSDLFWCHLTDLLEGLALKLISLDFDFIRCPSLSAQVRYLRSSFGRHVAVPQVPLFASALRLSMLCRFSAVELYVQGRRLHVGFLVLQF